MRTDILERKEEILQWIQENQSKAFISKELKCKQSTLNLYLEKMGISYAGNQGGKGIRTAPNYKSAEEYARVWRIMRYKLVVRGSISFGITS